MGTVYELLDRLTPEQAVEWLNQLTHCDLDFERLIELCNSGHCNAYIDCAGEQLLSPAEGTNLMLCGNEARIVERMMGEVLPSGQLAVYGAAVITAAQGRRSSQDDRTHHDALRIKLGGYRSPFFKPAEIQALATKLVGNPKTELHPNERRSVYLIINALAAMAKLDLSAPYAADETIRAFAASSGLELPDSPETLAKYFKAAFSTKKI